MATYDRQAIRTLNRLIRLCIASEKGFNVAAESVKNRGLKVMFKSYAQERLQYISELRDAVVQLGGEPAEGSGWLAAAHRGWINIKAAMTIGQPETEDVILVEVVRGENVARRTYEDALRKPLPPEERALVERQFERMQVVSERVVELQGRDGSRLVVRLFDTEEAATEAITQLEAAGFDLQRMEKVPLRQVVNIYEGQHIAAMTGESALAGALVGAGLGALLGFTAGISAMITPGSLSFEMGIGQTFLWTIALGAIAGVLFGALIGGIIGLGVSQEDDYGYHQGVKQGSIIVLLWTDTARAREAANIMRGVNARRWRLAT